MEKIETVEAFTDLELYPVVKNVLKLIADEENQFCENHTKGTLGLKFSVNLDWITEKIWFFTIVSGIIGATMTSIDDA